MYFFKHLKQYSLSQYLWMDVWDKMCICYCISTIFIHFNIKHLTLLDYLIKRSNNIEMYRKYIADILIVYPFYLSTD